MTIGRYVDTEFITSLARAFVPNCEVSWESQGPSVAWCASEVHGSDIKNFIGFHEPALIKLFAKLSSSYFDCTQFTSGLLFHEIAHALYTEPSQVEQEIYNKYSFKHPVSFQFFGFVTNIVEDSFIEKMFTSAYPWGYIQKSLAMVSKTIRPAKVPRSLDSIHTALYVFILHSYYPDLNFAHLKIPQKLFTEFDSIYYVSDSRLRMEMSCSFADSLYAWLEQTFPQDLQDQGQSQGQGQDQGQGQGQSQGQSQSQDQGQSQGQGQGQGQSQSQDQGQGQGQSQGNSNSSKSASKTQTDSKDSKSSDGSGIGTEKGTESFGERLQKALDSLMESGAVLELPKLDKSALKVSTGVLASQVCFVETVQAPSQSLPDKCKTITYIFALIG